MASSFLSCRAHAEKLCSLGQMDEATQLVLGEVENSLTSSNVRIGASDYFRGIGDYEGSMAQMEAALDIKPDNVDCLVRIAQDLISLHRYEEAMVYAKKLREYPSHPGARSIDSSLKIITDCLLHSPALLKAWELSRSDAQNPLVSSSACPSLEVQPFQYWSQGDPPSDVQVCTNHWNSLLASIGLPSVHLFTKETAAEWITSYAPDFEAPFASAYHYAIEANVFRIAYVSSGVDCMWIDIDMVPRRDTASILLSALSMPSSLLFFREYSPWISNCFFIARKRCLFFQSLVSHGKMADFSVYAQDTYPWTAPLRPPSYNESLKSLIISCLPKVSVASLSSSLASIDLSGMRLSFCNENSFASMTPAGGLKYKQTDDSWQRRFRRA